MPMPYLNDEELDYLIRRTRTDLENAISQDAQYDLKRLLRTLEDERED